MANARADEGDAKDTGKHTCVHRSKPIAKYIQSSTATHLVWPGISHAVFRVT